MFLPEKQGVFRAFVEIYETDQMGSVTQVSVFDDLGLEAIIWQGTDPTSTGNTTAATAAAVGLNSANGRLEWATSVTASSGYRNSPTTAFQGSWWKVW